MPTTSFTTKVSILGELWRDYRDEITGQENWEEFFEWADVALPLSFVLSKGYAQSPSSEGVTSIEEAWRVFCEMIELDPEADYQDLADCFEKSPQSES